jgi:hypothetical protein
MEDCTKYPSCVNLSGAGRKMSVVHDSLQDLRAGKNTELPSNTLDIRSFPKICWKV